MSRKKGPDRPVARFENGRPFRAARLADADDIEARKRNEATDLLRRALDSEVLGRQPPEGLPALATEALVLGADTPALRLLAGTRTADYQDARDLFHQAIQELGIAEPTREEALWRSVRQWAQDLVDGVRTPYEASRLIWSEGWERLGRPEQLTPFVALASQWEDDPPRRSLYEADMKVEATELLDDP